MKRLFARICLLHAATLGAMEQKAMTPHCTFDLQATEKYYADQSVGTSLNNNGFLIATKQSVLRNGSWDNVKITIDTKHITEKVVYVNTEGSKKKDRLCIDVKRVDKDETINLFFDNEDDYTSFFKLIKSKAHTVVEMQPQIEMQQLLNQQANNLFYKKLTLGVAAAFGLGLGGYLIYKTNPTWFANGFMKFFGSLNFGSIFKR